MTAVDDILGALPVEQVAQQTGSSPDEIRTTAAAVLPALLGGLQANAGDDSGAGSLLEALGQHDPDLLSGGADLDRIDPQDGQVIASHIFGDQQDEVANRLGGLPGVGGSGAGGALVKKLIPILAPMVLSWLANKVLRGGASSGQAGGSGGGLGDVIGDVLGGGSPGSSGSSGSSPSLPGGSSSGAPGGLQDMLRDVLGGATGGGASSGSTGSGTSTASPGGLDAGSIIEDVLGGILGGGRR
ncbi:DUF937 domain-containing protein [Oryzobacter terrae]|uniref:DUF937 domain-containing protein n=1 Tax=Oryzobacter terrae TaxID=1620385 RepID=UPI00366F23A3